MDDTSPAASFHRPTLVFVRGLPGSGKTYLSNALRQAVGADTSVVLDPDATDYHSQAYLTLSESLTAEGVDKKFHPYRFLRAQAHQAILDGKLILWNQPFTHLEGFQKTVINMETFASDHVVTLPMLIVEVQADRSVAKQRVDERKSRGGHGPSDTTFVRFVNDYESFARYGFNTVSVDGQDDVQESARIVLQALHDL